MMNIRLVDIGVDSIPRCTISKDLKKISTNQKAFGE